MHKSSAKCEAQQAQAPRPPPCYNRASALRYFWWSISARFGGWFLRLSSAGHEASDAHTCWRAQAGEPLASAFAHERSADMRKRKGAPARPAEWNTG